MVVIPHASVKRLGLMEEMFGVFSESINSRRWNNSFFVHQTNHGKNLIKWLQHLKSSTKPLSYHIMLSRLYQEGWMMLLQWRWILRPGFQDTVPTESLYHAQIVLISNQEPLELDMQLRTYKKVSQLHSCIYLMVPSVLLRERYAVLWRTTRLQRVLGYQRHSSHSWWVKNLFHTTKIKLKLGMLNNKRRHLEVRKVEKERIKNQMQLIKLPIKLLKNQLLNQIKNPQQFKSQLKLKNYLMNVRLFSRSLIS